jgi:DNA polymerase III alpha subunit
MSYLYPEMEAILKDTYSVIVYQEQVLSIAKEMAQYSLKEADLLRRAMGKKIKSEMAMHKEKFVNGILNKRGDAPQEREKAELLFENLARFASYGFPKAHAAPYGIMTYQTAFLKANYTKEFICASLIYETKMEKCEELMQEAKKMGVKIYQPSINDSEYNFSLFEDGIIYGLSKIKGIGESSHAIIEERNKNGKFTSVQDFVSRTGANKKVFEGLVFGNAFECVDQRNMAFLLNESENKESISLFDFSDLNTSSTEFTKIEIIKHNFEALGTVFADFTRDLNGLKVKNKLDDVSGTGLVYAIGIKSNSRTTRENKVLKSYQFLDQNGVQEILTDTEFPNQFEEVILEVEKMPTRYVLKNLYTQKTFFKRYRKVFLSGAEVDLAKLEDGDASLFVDGAFVKNIALSFDFMEKYQSFMNFTSLV